MTTTNLAAARAILEISKSPASNFPEWDFKTYEWLAAFGCATVNTNAGEGGMPEIFPRAAFARFPELHRDTRSDRSESTLAPSTQMDTARTSHTGEIARAKAIQRIGELKECAKEEKIEIDDASQWDLLEFISGYTSPDDLNIFLLDGGTFRVIWKTSPARQVGFEFLGKGALKKTLIVRNLSTGQYSASSELGTLQVDAGS